MASPKKAIRQVSAWRTATIIPTITNTEAPPAKMWEIIDLPTCSHRAWKAKSPRYYVRNFLDHLARFTVTTTEDKTVRKEHDEHTQEVMDCIERELSKGQTRGIYTDERKEWIGRRKFPYGYEPVYVKDPDGLYFPEHHGYTPLIFILDRQYDATEHAVRFIRGNTIDELYGWTNNGQLRVHIISSGDSHSARIRTLRKPSWHLQ